ncbi:MAG: hydantoinase B/oxoprolinase family protein [Armatimonadota bacterium]|nr:hydantoinase B/oxoprolinase family protein [Armatimonadota bacterium]
MSRPPVVDPVTFEVVAHRLGLIAEEMGIIYMRTSGSHVLVTGNDAATGIALPDGALVIAGPYITTQANVFPLVIASTQRLCAENPGIHDGDVFICNDPYLGAIHQPDIATVAPVFAAGRLVAWVGASGHQLDNGGTDPGGFSVGVVDVHQEGLRMPPVKLVEEGRLREDIVRWILNAVRDPLVGLDIKAQLAALTAGRRRLAELIDRYGLETVEAVMRGMLDYAERRLRLRLRELPDAVVREVQYIDHDGHAPNVYQVVCTVTKRDDRLHVDFTGTDPAPASLINCTASGLLAGVLTAVYVQLGYDLPWNWGIRRCVEITAPDGCLVNASYPRPCSMATISAVIIVIDCVFAALAKILSCSPAYAVEATGTWTGTSMGPVIAGTSQHGFPFATTEMSHFAGGTGARSYADGVDTGGIIFNTTPNISNVEDIEADFPVLYLFRRHLQDSGGPGRWRGGVSGELAYVPHGAPRDDLECVMAATGAEQPNAMGLWGGLPGAAVRVIRVRETDIPQRKGTPVPLPATLAECTGRLEILPPKHPRTPFRSDDVWYHNWQGAGGYGDPLERAPHRVAWDVRRGLVSPEVARTVYGVVLDDHGNVDDDATAQRRHAIRADRRRGARLPTAGSHAVAGGGVGRVGAEDDSQRVGEYLRIDRGRRQYECGVCGHLLGPADASLYDLLAEQLLPLTAAGPVRGESYDRGRFALRALYCPGCWTQVEVHVQLRGGVPRAFRLLTVGAASPPGRLLPVDAER